MYSTGTTAVRRKVSKTVRRNRLVFCSADSNKCTKLPYYSQAMASSDAPHASPSPPAATSALHPLTAHSSVNGNGADSPGGWLGALPDELLAMVAARLDARALLRLAVAASRFRPLATEEWRECMDTQTGQEWNDIVVRFFPQLLPIL